MNNEELNRLVKATKLKIGALEKALGLPQGDISKIRRGVRQLKPQQEDKLRELAGLIEPTEEVAVGRRFIALCNKLNTGVEEMFNKLENPKPDTAKEEIKTEHPRPKMINF